MSEFREATAAVEALEGRLADLQASVRDELNCEITQDTQGNQVQQMQSAMELLLTALRGDVDETMEKYRTRCSMVDPVTQTARFGPKMLAKVQDMLRRYDAVKAAVETTDLLERVTATIDAWKKMKESLAEREAEEAAKRAAEAERLEAVRLDEQRRQQEEEQQQREEQEKQEQLRIKQLAVLAQQKREERERERREEAERLKAEQERLEQLNAAIQVGPEGLTRAIDMLLQSTSQDSQVFRQSLQKLLTVVSNICAAPENPAFRHIPKENVYFHHDLGQYEGGYQCLLALGFRELEFEEDKMVFILEEPDLSSDIDAWSNWFDGLKEMKQLIENKLE